MSFEVCTVKLDIRGQKYHSNVLRKVTPPEYKILQFLHSPYAVVFNGLDEDKIAYMIKITAEGRKRRPMNAAELQEKLVLRYGEKTFMHVFPGANPILPKTFKEIDTFNEKDIAAAEANADEGWELIPSADIEKPDFDLSLDAKVQTARGRVPAQKAG